MTDEPSSVWSHDRDPQEGDQLAQLTLDYLDVLNGSRDALPQLDHLSSAQQAQVLAAWARVDQIVVSEPLSELAADPTAIALGTVPQVLLDPVALRRERQRLKLRPSNLAEALRAKGWATSTNEVFTWERRAECLAPALIADLASALSISADSLTLTANEATEADEAEISDAEQMLLQALYSDELDEVVQQWAATFGFGADAARQDLQRRLSNAAHRGQRALTPHQWNAVVQVLLAAERARRGLPDAIPPKAHHPK